MKVVGSETTATNKRDKKVFISAVNGSGFMFPPEGLDSNINKLRLNCCQSLSLKFPSPFFIKQQDKRRGRRTGKVEIEICFKSQLNCGPAPFAIRRS